MPTYEYECSNCDTTHEVIQKMTDATLTECPECGHSPIRKLFTGVGVMFKGSGFYRNDSRSSGESGSTTAAKSDSPKSDSSKSDAPKSDSPKSDSSSSAKKETKKESKKSDSTSSSSSTAKPSSSTP